MNRTGRLIRARAVVMLGMVLVASIGPGMPALATHGTNGDPLSSVPKLFPSEDYGTITGHEDITKVSPGKVRGCGGIGHENGASAYKLSISPLTEIKLTVTDDLGGPTLCDVHLYRQHLGEDELPSLYGYPDLNNYRVDPGLGNSHCPYGNSVCRMTWRPLPARDGYYLVFWPAAHSGNSSSFRFDISVRRVTATSETITGHSTYSSGCYNVRSGRTWTATTQTSQHATGSAVFVLEQRQGSSWKRLTTATRTLSSSSARYQKKLNSLGRYRVRATYSGSSQHTSSISSWRCINIIR